jgi:hypothetical protein
MSEEEAVEAVAESPEFIAAVRRYADGTTADHQFIREIVAAVNKVIPASSPMRTGNLPQMDAQGRVKVAPRWRPIETAPKEPGKRVLIWISTPPAMSEGWPMLVRWDEKEGAWIDAENVAVDVCSAMWPALWCAIDWPTGEKT